MASINSRCALRIPTKFHQHWALAIKSSICCENGSRSLEYTHTDTANDGRKGHGVYNGSADPHMPLAPNGMNS